jgi:hypothetical protein
MSEKIDIDLDPKKVLDSLNDMAEHSKKLADDVEESLGKRAPKSISTMEEAAEKGTAKIQGYFRNLGTRVKEDLKTAFDVGKLLGGIKLTNELAQGTKQVFEMERAFDRLNTRLGLSGKALNDFKSSMGRKVAATGQTLESVLPGVETAAARGNIRSPAELSAIAGSLGQAKAATGEDTGALSETITDILKNQGKAINAKTFKATLDAIQGTRIAGSFGSAQEAGQAISTVTQGLSPAMMNKMGLGTREVGGMAAAASKAGPGGNDILNHILQMASQAGGKSQLNALFGTNLFKNGKMDMAAFQKIKPERLGQFSEQTLASATGANQADLARFLTTMKGGMADFNKVTQGSNETAAQFATATDNLASRVDQFKEGAKEAGREMGESMAVVGKDLISGHFKEAGKGLVGVGKTAYENKGMLAGILGLSAGAGLLMGSGAKGLLGKIPGLGGVLGGEAAKAMGIQPVYVTNAKEISSGGSMASDFFAKMESMAGGAGAGGLLARAGALGSAALPYAGVAAAGAAGYGIGTVANMGIDKLMGPEGLGGKIYDLLHPSEQQPTNPKQANAALTPEAVQKAVHDGTVSAHEKVNSKTASKTNASAPPHRGAGM